MCRVRVSIVNSYAFSSGKMVPSDSLTQILAASLGPFVTAVHLE